MLERRVFEDALLGFLMEGEGYGYDLAQHFDEGGDLASVGRVGRSQLYALLRAVEEKGFAHSALAEGEGGPARRVFRITEEGARRFRAWVEKPVASIRGLRVEFLLKLYFVGRLGLPGRDALLEAQKSVLTRRLGEVEAAGGSRAGVGPWVSDLQARLLRAGLQWIDEWREREPVVPAREDPGGPPPGAFGRRGSNRLPALVIGHEAAGGMVRVDLDLGGGRVAAFVPREAAEELRVREGGALEVVLPPGGLVLARPGRAPDGEVG